MLQFDCASCGRPIVSRYDGRLVLQRDFNPYRSLPSFTIHHVCMRKWERGNPEAWMWLPLSALQGGE